MDWFGESLTTLLRIGPDYIYFGEIDLGRETLLTSLLIPRALRPAIAIPALPSHFGLVSRTWPDVAIAGAHRPGFTDKPRRPRQLASANTPTHPFIHRKGGRGHVWDGLAVRVHK